jgi:hypothetical protein
MYETYQTKNSYEIRNEMYERIKKYSEERIKPYAKYQTN